MVLHGIKKDSFRDEEAKNALKKKCKLYKELLHAVLQYKKVKDYGVGPLDHCAALLEINPDVSTAWNYRREALVAQKDTLTEDEHVETSKGEFALTEKALRRNPKSYSAWHHRRWLVEQGLGVLKVELCLCNKMLDLDERNFHCWEYRRFIASSLAVPVEEELEFTEKKIEQNFSNYSAWHQRTLMLKHVEEVEGERSGKFHPGKMGVQNIALSSQKLDQEYDLVHQAFFTEPEDQSGWFYYLWLFGNTLHKSHMIDGYTTARLEEEIRVCREVLDLEPSSKWVLLALARLLATRGKHDSVSQNEVHDIYRKLQNIDPMRKLHYVEVQDKQIAFSSI